tara:strand:+ start:85 stop:255 length:171 start_codon:yes stop_codon:yes gene_type:complete
MYNVEICNKCDTPLEWAESATRSYNHNQGDYYEVFKDVQYCEKCDLKDYNEEDNNE